MNNASESRFLGEYRLCEVLTENAVTRTWLGEQVTISRDVLVDELRPESAAHKEVFLANVKAKAAVDHPLIGSVYEAVDLPEHCFCARELLRGESLDQHIRKGRNLSPAQLAQLLHQVAVAQLHHQSAGHATSALSLDHIHLDEHGVVRLDNLAIAGTRASGESVRDIACLGEALRPLVAQGQPGSTRVLTLLSWMRGEGLAEALDWQQVADLCARIEHQLSEPAPTPTVQAAPPKKRHRLGTKLFIPIGSLLALLAVLLWLTRADKPENKPAMRMDTPDALNIPAGIHVMPDGGEHQLAAFRIEPVEVTIGQYAAFLETLETLAKDGLERAFDHAQQPPDKSGHVPDDWQAMLSAAKSGAPWNQRSITLDSPVTGVDWWDAAAYAEWKKARLPSQEEWFAANGMPGVMSGAVWEWTRQPATNPANPLGERMWVILRGSSSDNGRPQREWVSQRDLRRPDLGFRIAWDGE